MYFMLKNIKYEIDKIEEGDILFIGIINKPSDLDAFLKETSSLKSLTVFNSDNSIYKKFIMSDYKNGFVFAYK